MGGMVVRDPVESAEMTYSASKDGTVKIVKAIRRTVMRAVDGKTSNWLTVMPFARHQVDLSAVEFSDALAMRYSRPLLRMPANCDGCGGPFDLTHALDCKKVGLVTQRHNEVRDAGGGGTLQHWPTRR